VKIGIITFHFPINYGAVLQTYALYKTLTDMGHDVEIIDYQPDYHVKKYAWSWRYCGLHIRNLILPKLHRKFDKFRKTHLKLTPRLYSSLDDLITDSPVADAYICGSDQIWNPDLTSLDPAYFLQFGGENIKRIAYAGSFGKSTLTQGERSKIKLYTEGLDFISVREQSGLEIINSICKKGGERVVDPTMLINDYGSIAKPASRNKRFVLVVNLQNNPLLRYTSDLISKELGLPLIILNNLSMKLWNQKGKRLYPSPEEYLSLIQDADYIITNSFHGTIFSLIFKKPFLTTPLNGKDAVKNNRINGLLESCGLSDRFVENFSKTKIIEQMKKRIDWNQTMISIEIQRNKSLFFLQNALNM